MKILWKYCDKISKWLFLILFLPFIHTFPFIIFFFSWFFLHHTRIPLSPPTLLFLFLFLVHSGSLVCVVASRTLLPLCFFFFLSLSLTQTHKFLSLYLTQINSLSYTHRSPAKKWRSAFYTDRPTCFFFFCSGLISFILLFRFH